MVVCLKVPATSNAGALMRALDSAESRVPLMRPPYPDREDRWTCRVWVKEVLRMLQADGHVLRTMDVGELLPPVHSDGERPWLTAYRIVGWPLQEHSRYQYWERGQCQSLQQYVVQQPYAYGR